MPSEPLKACPFCAEAGEIEHSYHEDDIYPPRDFWHVRVKCSSCGTAATEWLCYGNQEQKVANFHVKQDAERRQIEAWNTRATPPAHDALAAEQCVMVCPQCEGEGGYADGLDEAACHTDCTRCGTNGWIVDLAALASPAASAKGDDVVQINRDDVEGGRRDWPEWMRGVTIGGFLEQGWNAYYQGRIIAGGEWGENLHSWQLEGQP